MEQNIKFIRISDTNFRVSEIRSFKVTPQVICNRVEGDGLGDLQTVEIVFIDGTPAISLFRVKLGECKEARKILEES